MMHRRHITIVSIFAALHAFAAMPRLLAAAEDDQGGLEAAKEPLGKLLALALKDGCLVLDQESWVKHKEVEPQDPEEAKKAKKIRIARAWGMPVEHVNDAMLKRRHFYNASDLPFAALFHEAMALGGGRLGGSGSGTNGTHAHWDANRPAMKGHLEYDSAKKTFGLQLNEKGAAERSLSVSDAPAKGLTLQLDDQKAGSSLLLTQAPGGPFKLVIRHGKESTELAGASFEALLKSAPDRVQLSLLRPLAKLGITLPPSPYLPTVMAAATSGFGVAAPDTAKQADQLIAKLSDEDMEIREQATQELVRLFPHAVRHLEETLKNAGDEETKMRLRKVSAAHPGIAKARPFVLEKKLHEDRAYLLEILAHVPFFKSAARARLAELYGKDHGDEPAAWPK